MPPLYRGDLDELLKHYRPQLNDQHPIVRARAQLVTTLFPAFDTWTQGELARGTDRETILLAYLAVLHDVISALTESCVPPPLREDFVAEHLEPTFVRTAENTKALIAHANGQAILQHTGTEPCLKN